MKVFIVLCLAVASTCAFDLRGSKNVDISPVVPFFEPESRIANGKPAKDNEFPYQVGLSRMISPFQSGWCGGSLIGTNWVLTAAHCVEGVFSITAYVGSTTRHCGQAIPVTEMIKHSGWNSNTLANDIALLRIPTVSLSSSVNIIALPAISGSYSTYVNEVAIASGWGMTSDSGTLSSTLQWASLTIVNNDVCSNVYGTSIVQPSNLCVATPSATSTCNGDSGGPLAITDKSGKTIQVGLTYIRAAAGCTLGYPAVFARVTSYLGWIQENTGIKY